MSKITIYPQACMVLPPHPFHMLLPWHLLQKQDFFWISKCTEIWPQLESLQNQKTW